MISTVYLTSNNNYQIPSELEVAAPHKRLICLIAHMANMAHMANIANVARRTKWLYGCMD